MNKVLKKITYNIIIFGQIIFVFIFSLNFVSASSLVGDASGCNCAAIIKALNTANTAEKDECYKYCTGNYEVNDFVQILINGVNILFGLVGTLTLAMFIYGGLMFLISSGNTERLTKAKQILINASIGLVIIFTSYLIIQFVLTSLGYTNSNWFTAPTN